MSLNPGTRLGPFEISEKLGEGGMGEVWRARDSKLRRDVAIKVLPAAFTADADRLARFEREAQLLAQLQHPNIASIYGLEESEGTRALVMELVDGPTLAERLEVGPLPLEESLTLAVEIARALEAAHEKGIIHRDLKPQNIKATVDGRVKVLDFGLAKAMEPAGSGAAASELAKSPTLTMGATLQGLILGTAAYMSPEQAKGMAVDKRADIWAFGVVLYEMLAGKRLFTGDSAGDTLAAVIRAEIDFAALPAATPRRVRDLLRRCLERNPKNRLHDIADARIEIEHALARPEEESVVAGVAPPLTSRWRPSPWAAVAALFAAALFALLLFGPARPAAPTPVAKTSRLVWNLPPGLQPVPVEEESPLIAISPDGTKLAAVLADGSARRQIYIRALDSLESKALPGTDGASEPIFSPDGRSLAFFAEGELRKVVIESGRVSKVMDAIDSRGLAWAPDGTLLVVPEIDRGLVSVTETGGAERTVAKPDAARGERTFRWPQLLPGGRVALFTVGTLASPDFYDNATIEAIVLATGKRKLLYEGASFARYSPAAGELVLGRSEGLFAVPFDPEKLEITGRPRQVLDGIATDVTTGAIHASVAADGTLVYLATEARAAESRLAWLSPEGKAEPIGAPPRTYWSWSLSPDGAKLVALVAARERGELWIYDATRDVFSRLATNERCYDPLFTPDGRYVIYSRAASATTGTEIVRRSLDGGEPELLLAWPNGVVYVRSIPADGSRLFFEANGGTGQVSDIYAMALVPGAEAERIETSRDDEYFPSISPDGRWLAYVSQQSGRGEVYLRPYPATGSRLQVSNQGGAEPRWSADGRTLYFRTANSISKVDLRFEPRLEASAPQQVAGIRLSARRSLFTYTLGKDGRFLAILPGEEAARSEIVVVLDWAAELRRSLAAAQGKP